MTTQEQHPKPAEPVKDELDELDGLTEEDLAALDDLDDDDLLGDDSVTADASPVEKDDKEKEMEEKTEAAAEEKEKEEEEHHSEAPATPEPTEETNENEGEKQSTPSEQPAHIDEEKEKEKEEEEEEEDINNNDDDDKLNDLTEEELRELKELEAEEEREKEEHHGEEEHLHEEGEGEGKKGEGEEKEEEHQEHQEHQETTGEENEEGLYDDDLYGEDGGLLENDKMLDELSSLYDALEIARLDKELAEEKVLEYEEVIAGLREEVRARDEKLALDIKDVDVRTLMDENNKMKAALVEIQQVSEEEARETEEIITELEAKNAELEQALAEKTEALDRCTEERNELKELLDQLYDVQTQLEGLTEENAELKEKNTAFRRSLEEFEELKQLSESVEAMQTEELTKLKAQVREMEDDEIEYKRTIEAALEKVQQKDILIAQLRETAEKAAAAAATITPPQSTGAAGEGSEGDEGAASEGYSAAAAELVVKIHTLEAKAAALTIEESIAELGTSQAEERLRFYRANLPEDFVRGDLGGVEVKLGLDRVERKAHVLRRLLENSAHLACDTTGVTGTGTVTGSVPPPDEALYFTEMCLDLADIEYAANAFAYRLINIRHTPAQAGLAELPDLERMLRGLEKTIDGVLLLAKRDQLTVSYPLYTLAEVKERITAAATTSKLFDESAAISSQQQITTTATATSSLPDNAECAAFRAENETRRAAREVAYKLGRLLLHCRAICAAKAGVEALSRNLRATHPDFGFDPEALAVRVTEPVPMARIEECVREGLGAAGVLETGAAVSFANGMSLADILKILIDANIAASAAAADIRATYTALKNAANDGDSAAFEAAAAQAAEKIGWTSLVTFLTPVSENISKVEVFRRPTSAAVSASSRTGGGGGAAAASTMTTSTMYTSGAYNYLGLDNWLSARVRSNRAEISEINNTKHDLELLKSAHERLNTSYNQNAFQLTELRSLNTSLQDKVASYMAEIDAVKKRCEAEASDQKKALDLSRKEVAELKKELYEERIRTQRAAAAAAAAVSAPSSSSAGGAAAAITTTPAIAQTPLFQGRLMTSSLRTRSNVAIGGGVAAAGGGAAMAAAAVEEARSLGREVRRLKVSIGRLIDENRRLSERVLALNVKAIERTNAAEAVAPTVGVVSATTAVAGDVRRSYNSRLMIHLAGTAVVDLRNKGSWTLGNALVSSDLRVHTYLKRGELK